MKEIYQQYHPEFVLYNHSSEVMTLREFMTNVLLPPDHTKEMNIMNCLITTICTDRPLPDSINDYIDESIYEYIPNEYSNDNDDTNNVTQNDNNVTNDNNTYNNDTNTTTILISKHP
jgi:hypothetical protein